MALTPMWVLRRIGVSLGAGLGRGQRRLPAIRLVPGDPAELLLSQGGAAPDPAAVAELREQLGLDRPVWTQYVGQPARACCRAISGESLQDQARSPPRSSRGCRARWN